MRAELRRLHSPDATDLRTWTPPTNDFGILVQLMIGPKGEPGEESFDVTICTVGWLTDRIHEARIVDLRHHVLVASYDYLRLERYLLRQVSACEGPSWPEVAALVGRIGRWEFEDYQAHP